MTGKGRAYWIPAAVAAAALFYGLAFHFWPLPGPGAQGCDTSSTTITSIQGTGPVTPLDGERVETQGVVTADATAEQKLGGFFIQQTQFQASEHVRASRGLFVYAPNARVRPGEKLRISGEAGEYHGMTQLSDASIRSRCGKGHQVSPVRVELPLSETRRHQLQGMKVRVEPPVTITGLDELGPYGTVTVADGRLFVPTQVSAPGRPAERTGRYNRYRLLRIDDASRKRDPRLPSWIRSAMADNGTVRVGDRLEAVAGVLDYRYDHWRLQPLEAPVVINHNARPQPLKRPRGDRIRVASFNVENYFNGDGQGGGFPTPRGADNPEELARQQARLVAALKGLAADIVGLIELENDGYDRHSAIAALVEATGKSWDYIRPDADRLGSDAITVGLMYRKDRLHPVGRSRTLRSGPFSARNRPPLAQRFRHEDSGESFWVIVNHFKSKYCGNALGANAEQGDGQGCWNPVRVSAAEALARWIASLGRRSGQKRFLLLGDLNAYAQEEPIEVLARAGFRNGLDDHHPLPASGYIYRARSGTLDYILASEGVHRLIVDAGVWPINADEPPILDYDAVAGRDLPDPVPSPEGPWRSSDHDPTWVDLAFEAGSGR